MKKLGLSILFAVTAIWTFGQEVYIVDNNFNAPTGANIFSTLQAAADAAEASPGVDIIQVKPSPTLYGDVTITTQVILEGIGFNLTKDFADDSRMDDITLTDKADASDNASGTIIRGMRFDYIYLGTVNSGTPYTLSNVVIENCDIMQGIQNYVGDENVDNLEVKFSRLREGGSFYDYDFGNMDNSTIRNCVISGRVRFNDSGVSINTIANNFIYDEIYVLSFVNSVFVTNNYFIGTTGSSAFYSQFRNGTVSENVFFGRAARCASESDFTGNNFSNNLTFSTSDDTMPPPSNSGAQNLEAQNPLFNNVTLTNGYLGSEDFNVDALSPVYFVNNGFRDIGVEFGPYPWTQSNLVLRAMGAPTIEILNTTAVVNPGDNLNVRVKVKGN